MDKRKIGLLIAELRKNEGMTQEEVGKKLFVDRATVSKWERGDYIPNPEMLLSLSQLFDISVNELLLGEKMTSENKEKINNVTVEVLKDSRKKVKKALFGSITIITILLFIFLGYYFINTYNSIKVYKITGEDESFYMEDGIMVMSREKAYIKLGNIKGNDETNIDKFRLYYKKNGEEKNMFISSEVDKMVTNIFDYDEFFTYKDFNELKNNLFLEIIFDDEESVNIKLKLTKDFSNNFLFKKKNSVIADTETNINDVIIPAYIKNNFILDSKQELYYLDSEFDDIKVHQKYFYNFEMYILEEEHFDYINHFEYLIQNGDLIYYKITDSNMEESFTYNFIKKDCIFGQCNMELVNDFQNRYIGFTE